MCFTDVTWRYGYFDSSKDDDTPFVTSAPSFIKTDDRSKYKARLSRAERRSVTRGCNPTHLTQFSRLCVRNMDLAFTGRISYRIAVERSLETALLTQSDIRVPSERNKTQRASDRINWWPVFREGNRTLFVIPGRARVPVADKILSGRVGLGVIVTGDVGPRARARSVRLCKLAT